MKTRILIIACFIGGGAQVATAYVGAVRAAVVDGEFFSPQFWVIMVTIHILLAAVYFAMLAPLNYIAGRLGSARSIPSGR